MANGRPIEYSVEEVENEALKNAGYTTTTENGDGYTIIKNITTRVEISKVELSGSEEIAGAELEILDGETKDKVVSWNRM